MFFKTFGDKNMWTIDKIVKPSGEELILCGLRQFCEDNNLRYNTVLKYVNKGKILRTHIKDTSFFLF